MVERKALEAYLNTVLEPERYRDYAPNGLQVEGKSPIRRLVTGVSASLALIESAVAIQADAILVHHGYFWRGESPQIVAHQKKRLQLLLQSDINLFAYHLPLDVHPELGNNVQLARLLGWEIRERLPIDETPGLLCVGSLPKPLSAPAFIAQLEKTLMRTPLHIPGSAREIQTLAWCTGAAQRYINQAADLGVDAYLSGEISEPTVHSAREREIHFFSAGHHATERYGVKALGEQVALQFGVEHHFIDIENPV